MSAPALDELFPQIGPWTRSTLAYPDVTIPATGSPTMSEVTTLGTHRLAARALDMVHSLDAEVDPTALRALRRYEFAASAMTARALAGAQASLDLLQSHGVRALVIKGPGIADVYRKAKWRPYSDVDVLVHPKDFPSALRLLQDNGWSRTEPRPLHRPYFARHCVEGINLARENGADRVDLHHAITPWLWGQRLRFDDLWERSHTLAVGGYRLPVVSTEDNLVIAALHLVSDHSAPGKTLMIWQDLLEMLVAVPTDRILARLDEVGLRGWMSSVLDGVDPDMRRIPAGLGAGPRTAVAHATRLRLLLQSSNGGRPAVEWLCRLPLRKLPLFLLGLVLPSTDFLEYEGLEPNWSGYAMWWRSLRRPAVGASEALSAAPYAR